MNRCCSCCCSRPAVALFSSGIVNRRVFPVAEPNVMPSYRERNQMGCLWGKRSTLFHFILWVGVLSIQLSPWVGQRLSFLFVRLPLSPIGEVETRASMVRSSFFVRPALSLVGVEPIINAPLFYC